MDARSGAGIRSVEAVAAVVVGADAGTEVPGPEVPSLGVEEELLAGRMPAMALAIPSRLSP
jgi:hypothetical protein